MRRSHLSLVALLGGASAAFSQSPPLVEERITVTATASAEPVDEVPATVDLIRAAEIEERKVDQVLDLLRNVAGLDVVQSGSRGKSTTLFTRGTNSSHTLVLWNGVELNDPFLGGFDWSTVATDGVEQLEVVRGPYSALYGSSALGGVVQLVTRRRDGQAGGSARAEAGSNDFLRAGAAGGFAFGALAIDLAGHVRRGDGEVDNDFYDGEGLDLTADAELGESSRLSAMARLGQSRIGVPFNYLGIPTPESEQEFDSRSLAIPYSFQRERGGLETLLARTDTELVLSDPDDPFAGSRADASRDQARLVTRFRIGETLDFAAGGDWERQEVTSSDAFGPGLDAQRQDEWAAFGQLSWRPAEPALRLDLGVRRDENDAFGGETSARAAVAWAPATAFRLRAGYGEAFRAPSLADLYFPGFGNPDLQPERSTSFELGCDGEADWFSYALVLFENDLDNLIEFDFATFLPKNIGRARARGVEFSAAARGELFEAQLAATYLDGENLETGGPLLRRPREKASLSLFARPADWTIGTVVRHVGERIDFGDIALPAYTAVELTVATRLGRWEPFARVENLFDEEYEEAAGFPAPGIAFAAGVDVRF